MEESTIPQECLKIMERLYIFVDTKDVQLNARLNLVVNPEIIKILFKQVEAQSTDLKLQIFKKISKIYNVNRFNSLILWKRDKQIMQFNHSILQSIIHFLYGLKIESKQVKQVSELIVPFIHAYPINCKIVKSILSVLIKDFYDQKANPTILQLSIVLLQKFLKQQRRIQQQPCSYFITYGWETGIKMINHSIKWPFSKGFYFYMKFYIQNVINEDMILFNLSIQQDQFSIFITPDSVLKIKIFSSSQIIQISHLQRQKWITLSLSYIIKSKLLRNCYELTCNIDGDIYQKRDLPVPSVSMSDQILELTLGTKFYGKIHSVALSRTDLLLGNKLIMNTWKQIQSFLVINKKSFREVFIFYSPILTTTLNSKEIVYDISSQNHGQMYQNTGIHEDPFRQVDINYYGGLYTYLPLVHLLKFYEYEKYPQALTDIFQLFSIFFENKFVNVESEAINCQFFSIACQLMNEINPNFIGVDTIKVIKRINSFLTNMQLRREMLVNFLFKINVRKIENVNAVNSLHEIICEEYFTVSFQESFSLVSLDYIIHYIIDNFEQEKKELCCLHHYCHNQKEKEQIQIKSFKNDYLLKTTYLSKLLKIILTNIGNYKEARPIRTKMVQMLFGEYSSCLKLLLLQALNQGTKVSSRFLVQDLNLVVLMQAYLQKTQLPEQIACTIQILLNCQEHDPTNLALKNGNIQVITVSLDKIYAKKCEEGRFRGKSGAIKSTIVTTSRKHSSAEKADLKIEKFTKENTKKSATMRQKNSPIQTNRSLYQAIIKMCFEYNVRQQTWLLKSDDFCSILQPYFRLCCLDYRKNIINMIRNTVVSAFIGKKIKSQSRQFNKLYKLILTQFILKQLESDGGEMQPANLTNDIILNVYFVIDYTVINMREDWVHLYVYMLQLIGIMQQAKKEIAQKYLKSTQDLAIAVKFGSRKFVLRVVKIAEKNIFNFSNCIFLINLIIFSNYNAKANYQIFQYFRSLEKYLFVGKNTASNSQRQIKNKIAFLDSRIILQTINSFKLCQFDLLNSDWRQKEKIINAYLDLQYTNQSNQLYKSRFMYLIKAQFKQIKQIENHPIRELFSNSGKQNKNVISTGEIISIMICLCIQSSITTEDTELFNQSIKSLKNFMFWFLLLSSRDGLKLEKHADRNIQLPKIIAANVIHFLYFMLHSEYAKPYLEQIQDTLFGIFSFLGLLVRSLYQKLGNPQNFQKGLQKAAVMKNLQQYNFFTFELLKSVLALKDVKAFPEISRQKLLKVINHPKVSSYFKNSLSLSIQTKVEQFSNSHTKNMTQVKKQIEEYFFKTKINNLNKQMPINHEEFKKNFIFQHLRANNCNYRKIQRIWMKIWKRLRLYHYFWSISMNQREKMQLNFIKNAKMPYRHKLSKFLDSNGVRPVLEVQHMQPWHVKKVLMEKEYEYRNSNYLLNLHEHTDYKKKQKSFIEKLIKPNEQSAKFYVNWIKHNSKRKGYLSVQNQKIKFQYESTYQKDSHLEFSSFILAQYKPVQKYWPLVQISNIFQRRYLTKRQCLLIQFQDGTSLIFNFINQEKDDFMRLIVNKQNKTDKTALMKLNKIAFYTKKFDLQSNQAIQQANFLWKTHKISNFQYLMLVNKFAGRSYLDPANYPVFPWIIANFDCQRYKYRDLSKSVGALGNQQRIHFYHNKLQANDPFDPVPPYQFGTHYSSPGTVFGFLIRLQPYTEASRTLQGGKFDLSDRLFSSIKVCWHSVTTEVSDVRQLTPEFFYLPQFLLNVQHHDFGLTQQKERVHNVQLPYWANNAYEFIVTQRKQLQSDYVSENIGNWIDLIFGYKQKGKIAQENLNLFYYLTYEGAIDLTLIKDDQTRISNQAQIMHFGQTPTQIFTKPHGGRPKSKRFVFSLKKISLSLSLQSAGPMTILGAKDNKMYLFHDYNFMICQQNPTYSIQKQVRVLRNNSKQNIYFLEDIEFYKRVQLFNNQKYIAIASYINGDLLIFSLPQGKKVEEKKGSAKLCLLVNQKQDLLLVGGRNGLLEVYEIAYGQKDALTLIKIASEYYMAPIYSITQGGRFFCISSGSLVTLIRTSRALNYVYDKTKMRGVKMIRAIEVSKKVERCIISTDPLFCFVICTELELYCYSGNGQLLATKQVALTFSPIKFTANFTDYLAYLQNNRLKIVSLPFLIEIRDMQLPNKTYVEIKFYQNKCFLVTSFGQIITLSDEAQQYQ